MTLTDKQKQDIEQEAEKYWPAAVAFGGKARRAYIAGATAHALACIQKDEEIGRLTAALNHLKDVFAQRCAGDMLRMSIAQQRWVYDLILNYLKPPTTEAVKQ